MKKIIIAICLVFCGIILSACGSDKTDLALNNLAEVRYNIFTGENDCYIATFMSGKREKPYAVNGICEKSVEFGMLTIKYKTKDSPIVAQYNLKINDKTYSGNLEYNTYENTLMVDIQTVAEDDAEIVLVINTNKGEEKCNLVAKTTDLQITWRTALDIALSTLGEEVDEYILKGKFNGEVYVKIITDLNSTFDTYYWYVSIVGTNGNTNGVIIDTQTGEVIAKK